jgi:antirestriction protein ArdC
MKTNEHFAAITAKIIQLLESQLDGWKKPWIFLGADGKRAYNISSNRTYHGVNQLLLSLQALEHSYPFNQWLTFKQANSLGGKIKSGEQATYIYFFDVIRKDKDGKVYALNEFQALSDNERKGIRSYPFLRCYPVFNRAQVSQLLAETSSSGEKIQPRLDEAESIIEQTGADIEFLEINSASYSLRDDVIKMPAFEYFPTMEGYYATVFHELGHWTGHPDRLDRSMENKLGSEEYAFEELVAELATAFICAELGFEKEISQNAAYIKSWIKILEGDQKAIWAASNKAEQAAQYIMTPREF